MNTPIRPIWKPPSGCWSSKFGETEILAGGTDLVTSLKQGLVSPKRLVNLKGISSLKGIEATGDTVRIGATTPLVDVLENDRIQKEFPAIIQAIEGIGSPQIINMGTIAGDLCQRPRCWYYRQGFGLLGRARWQVADSRWRQSLPRDFRQRRSGLFC